MKIRKLNKEAVEKEPYLIWNAFVDLLAMEDYEDLSKEQRPAHLVFWYDSEVYNGGHDQYFHNRGVGHLSETLNALLQLGATCQHAVLSDAADRFFGRHREGIRSLAEFVGQAQEQEYSDLDARIYACSPSLFELLKDHLNSHQSIFVVIS